MKSLGRPQTIWLLLVIFLLGCSETNAFTGRPPGLVLPEIAPLNPVDIYAQVLPSVAYIETDTGSGSGILLENRYILTNAHVVWPARQVRAVFPDGSEFSNIAVVNVDLITDLAVLGPLKTNLPGVTLSDGEALAVGSSVYLIGYPGEYETFPQPAITGGLISRYRQWDTFDQSYFQTDAAIAGGQSGGVLVSDSGQVIGISGNAFTEANFGLVASFADNQARIAGLIAGRDVDDLAARPLPQGPGTDSHTFQLDNYWDVQTFLIDVPAWTEVEVELDGDGDGTLHVIDPFSNWILSLDEQGYGGEERGNFLTDTAAPYYILIEHFEQTETDYELSASEPLIPLTDPDDAQVLEFGQTIHGQIDHPGDIDYYLVELAEAETVTIMVDSLMIDPYLTIDFPGAAEGDMVSDDNGWGSLFQAEVVYTAPENQQYIVAIRDYSGEYAGGYQLVIQAGE